MTPEQKIEAWLWNNRHKTFSIAKAAVTPLLLSEDGNWIEDADFPSGSDYIEDMTGCIDECGLYEHINKLQNEKTD